MSRQYYIYRKCNDVTYNKCNKCNKCNIINFVRLKNVIWGEHKSRATVVRKLNVETYKMKLNLIKRKWGSQKLKKYKSSLKTHCVLNIWIFFCICVQMLFPIYKMGHFIGLGSPWEYSLSYQPTQNILQIWSKKGGGISGKFQVFRQKFVDQIHCSSRIFFLPKYSC